MATAHKIAVIFYTMVKQQVEYDETLLGRQRSPEERNGWERNSNGQPNNWATNLSQSNLRPHNERVQHAAVPWKLPIGRRSSRLGPD
jgi:hypothetical protein